MGSIVAIKTLSSFFRCQACIRAHPTLHSNQTLPWRQVCNLPVGIGRLQTCRHGRKGFRMSENKGRQALPVILERLHNNYPNAKYELNWDDPVQLLVATILAAQCTDERVNQVTATLFKKYRNAQAFASADLEELSEDVR